MQKIYIQTKADSETMELSLTSRRKTDNDQWSTAFEVNWQTFAPFTVGGDDYVLMGLMDNPRSGRLQDPGRLYNNIASVTFRSPDNFIIPKVWKDNTMTTLTDSFLIGVHDYYYVIYQVWAANERETTVINMYITTDIDSFIPHIRDNLTVKEETYLVVVKFKNTESFKPFLLDTSNKGYDWDHADNDRMKSVIGTFQALHNSMVVTLVNTKEADGSPNVKILWKTHVDTARLFGERTTNEKAFIPPAVRAHEIYFKHVPLDPSKESPNLNFSQVYYDLIGKQVYYEL